MPHAETPNTSIERYRRAIGWWLVGVAAMVFVMVIVGGLTRLTHSGLSMVEWRPLMGSVPPLTAPEWERIFEKYQEYPQFKLLNSDMTLQEFKGIFWFEYCHRLLGRVIGLAFFLPFVFFLFRRAFSKPMAAKMFLLFVLGGGQGVIGWWMVQSGMTERPDVSQYRLAIHLGAAFALYAALVWVALGQFPSLLHQGEPTSENSVWKPGGWLRTERFTRLLWLFAFVTILSGALVAGLNAGFAFNTFPLMNGQLIPKGLYGLRPWPINHFENHLTVQFQHRLMAGTLFMAIVVLWNHLRHAPVSIRTRQAAHAVFALACMQVLLGIATLLTVVWTPLASAHQTMALLLFTALTWLLRTLQQPIQTNGNVSAVG